MVILVLNCGSSSIKFQVIDPETEERLMGGLLSEIGSSNSVYSWQRGEHRDRSDRGRLDYEQGISLILDTISTGEYRIIDDLEHLDGIGHRVVHGGEEFTESTLITADVYETIERVVPLAPLHNPANLQGIATCTALLPNTPQVAVFDTSFHQTLPEEAFLYALPYRLYEEHRIRRYGFHGTSHRYVSERASKWLGREGNFISMHLGNGASATAIRAGRSVDTSMGMTPLEGLVMGTRSGDIDPSLVSFIAGVEGLSLAETENLLNKKSGLLGLSGGWSDMQQLQERADGGDIASERAITVFCYRAKQYIGAYLAVLGHTDAIIFTGGIGENAAEVRAQICADLEPLGIELDEEANREGRKRMVISLPSSRVALLVIPTNEELMIAKDTFRIVAHSR